MAGYIPNTNPTKLETPTAREIALEVIIGVKPSRGASAFPIPNPKAIPSKPPVKVKSTASIINCVNTAVVVAPTAFLKPISRVRSVTETSIIFIIPIPPTTRDIAAIPASKEVNKVVI